MKKIILLMMAAALVGLVGCGSEPQMNENIPTPTEKIEEVIAASTETPAPTETPVPTTPIETYNKTIEITEENWDVYFELVEDPFWKENAFGEGELFQIHYRLALKEEFKPFVLSADVAFGFESHKVPKVIEIDGPNFTYTITDEILHEGWTNESTVKFTLETEEWNLQVAQCEVYKDEESGGYYVYNADEILLTRVRGSMDVSYGNENKNLFEATEKNEEVIAVPTETPVPTATTAPTPTAAATPFPSPTPVIDEPSGPNYDPNVIAPKTEEEEETTPAVEEVFVDLNNPDYDTTPGAVWITMEFWLEDRDVSYPYCHASYYDTEGNLLTGGFWTKSYAQAQKLESISGNKMRVLASAWDYERRDKWIKESYRPWEDFLYDFKPVEE